MALKVALRNEAISSFQTKIIHPNNIVNYRNKEDFYTNKSYDNDIGVSLETHAEIKRKAGLLQKYHLSENLGKLENVRVKDENHPNYLN